MPQPHRLLASVVALTAATLIGSDASAEIQGGEVSLSPSLGGYVFDDEFVSELRHNRAGILSMANSGKNTNGSQFFITEVPTPHLDKRHAVFGVVTAGHDVIKDIANVDLDSKNRPSEAITVERVEIFRQ